MLLVQLLSVFSTSKRGGVVDVRGEDVTYIISDYIWTHSSKVDKVWLQKIWQNFEFGITRAVLIIS